jgi:hypothetical protein
MHSTHVSAAHLQRPQDVHSPKGLVEHVANTDASSAPHTLVRVMRARAPEQLHTTNGDGILARWQGRMLKFAVEKIGFKDENLKLVDPRICAYVVSGHKVGGVQLDSKVSDKKDGKYFLFGGDVIDMQQSFESILPGTGSVPRAMYSAAHTSSPHSKKDLVTY